VLVWANWPIVNSSPTSRCDTRYNPTKFDVPPRPSTINLVIWSFGHLVIGHLDHCRSMTR
jgi:hypothetical protein